MKKKFIIMVLVFIAFSPLAAQVLRSQSLNGSTGLYSIPTGRVGWEDSTNLGIDFGYRAIINFDNGTAHVPAVTFSMFRMLEASAAFDFQPDKVVKKNNDLLLGFKVKLSSKTTFIALGANIQFINLDNNNKYNAYQPYLTVTYPGTFFSMPAETTLVLGKTFYSGRSNNSNIDFGMGFDLSLLPNVFNHLVHLIIDFANFSYSDDSWPDNMAAYRAVFNAGIRFDLSTIPVLGKYKLTIDVAFNDLLDDWQRSLSIGAVFGLPLKQK